MAIPIETDAEYWLRRWNEAKAERDEAVRLLLQAKAWIDHEPLVNEIIAYLDKVGK